ncbi:helix-turn-helix domain-containing protein [Haloactinospora alba]
MTLTDVAGVLEWSPAKLGHIETGIRKWPSVMEVSALLKLYGVTGGRREAILTLARESRLHPWWTEYEDVLSSAYVGNESGAVTIETYSGSLIPDLLQAPEYTAALGRVRGHVPSAVERMVTASLKRQEVFERGTLERYHALVEEDALHRLDADPEMRSAQLHRLIELASDCEQVDIRILPAAVGLHAGAVATFTILGFDQGEPSLAFVDAPHGGSIVESEESVDGCQQVWRRLSEVASSPEDTITTLRRMALLG